MSVRSSHVSITTDMTLTDQQIDGFITLYEKHHGVVLSREDAIQKGVQLCRFVEMVEFDVSHENSYEESKVGQFRDNSKKDKE